MCKSSSITKPIDGGGAISTTIEYLIGVALFIYTIGFLFFRIGEIVPAISHYSLQCSSALLGNFFLHRALFDRRAKYLLHIASIVAIVYFLDTRLPKPLPSVANNESYTLKTVVVTGANAGMGYETSRQLAVKYGVQVIMGCRSEAKCNNAANAINAEIASTKSNGSATPLLIDLSNLDSVKSFASQLEDTSVDVVFNNAGYVPDQNLPVNSYGLDPSFTSMHLSHFYLTEQLLNLNPKLRMVNTSSGTHHTCAIPYAYIPSFLWNSIPPTFWKMLLPQNPGCIDDDYLQNGIRSKTDGAAYIQAKLANVMHAVELPRRHPGVTSIAIDLAWVGTTIQSWMQGQLVCAFALCSYCTLLLPIFPILNGFIPILPLFCIVLLSRHPRIWDG